MRRILSHSWDNRKEKRIKGRYNGWDRRMRWYCADLDERNKDIRICFEDTNGSTNKLYDNEESAKKDWDDFKNKRTDTLKLRE